MQLVSGELFPTQRRLNYEVQSTDMVGVEHLGQYVYEMTQAKVRQMGGAMREIEAAPVESETREVGMDDEEEDNGVVQLEIDDD